MGNESQVRRGKGAARWMLTVSKQGQGRREGPGSEMTGERKAGSNNRIWHNQVVCVTIYIILYIY